MTDWLTLNDGTTTPSVGFGTYPLKGDEGAGAVASAIRTGYRLIDTAVNYENEDAVGRGIRDSGIDRAELRVQSKLPGRHHAYDLALTSVKDSLSRLGLDYLDSYIIHWPNPITGRYVEAWGALVEAQKQGLVRSIGVSNFTPEHLRDIIEATGVTPAVNQVELHPGFSQATLRPVLAELGIQAQSWSPLGSDKKPAYEEPAVVEAAETHGVSAAQVILRWHVQLGSTPLPKSADPQRQRDNLALDFDLSPAEVEAITALDSDDARFDDRDPRSHEEM